MMHFDIFFFVPVYSSVDKHTGVKITRFLMYVEEMKKNESFGFEKEFKISIIHICDHRYK